LRYAQQLGLQRQRELADLVEKDRAGVGLDEQARLVDARVGERAALVAEQLALDQPLIGIAWMVAYARARGRLRGCSCVRGRATGRAWSLRVLRDAAVFCSGDRRARLARVG